MANLLPDRVQNLDGMSTLRPPAERHSAPHKIRASPFHFPRVYLTLATCEPPLDPLSLERTNKIPSLLPPTSPHLSGSKAVTLDLEDIQRKLESAQRELATTRAEYDLTKRETKAAELAAAEASRSNRRLRVEVQTLNDLLHRKDRQIEQSKATSFFFEGQLKKFEEEIDAARVGLERFKVLEEEAAAAQADAEEAARKTAREYESVRKEIDALNLTYRAEVDAIKAEIAEAQHMFLAESEETLKVAAESEARVRKMLEEKGDELKEVRAANEVVVGRQKDLAEMVEREVRVLKKVLGKEAEATKGHEATAQEIKDEMADLMRKLRTFRLTYVEG
ncbi:hypothetical protein BC936DRAFT_146584 [Jimgerdemannia flammicorona]|uniref:SWI5-dependent HO expression protein 3 n=1 Tax=Jimgerdemannia flammicorona TaxID=994334 RepID=A0A433D7Y4_9FUNG|nr:hypothetical protein BC936DRAFT_146584 [Jimgerdemannia flammicorona]